ncbi:MAG: hypothetical protein KJ063_10700 [Anaerolineae bacterium]|nr:hypothetical protein [Anaerolineae bacterium]
MARKKQKGRPPTSHHTLQPTVKQSLPAPPQAESGGKSEGAQLAPQNPITRQNILHWQKTIGNQAVATAIQRQTVTSLIAPIIQRTHSEYDYTTQVTTPIKVVVTLGKPGRHSETVNVKTNSDLADAYSELSSVMFFDRNEFFPDGTDNEYIEEWRGFQDSIDNYVRWYAKLPAKESPYIAEVKDMQLEIAGARKLAQKCRDSFLAKDKKFKAEISKARSQIDNAEKEAKKLLRAKFLSGDSSSDSTSGFLWAMTDHLFTFGGTLADTMDLNYIQALAAGKLIPGAVTLANVVVNWSSNNPMTQGSGFEGLATLNNVVNLGGAANSFFVNPGYLVTAYVGPMLGTIITLMGKLQTQLIERNDDAAAFLGTPLYINAEPGGAPMWNYMVTAMRASSAADISAPSGDVYKYFDKFYERFDQAGGAKYKAESDSYAAGDRKKFPVKPDNIPTERSWGVFTDVDAKKFPSWLFSNRQMVWTLLYGARDPKNSKLTTER